MNWFRWLLLLGVGLAGLPSPIFAQPAQTLFDQELNATPVPKPDLRLPQRPDTRTDSTTKARSTPPTASLWGTIAALGVMSLGVMLAVRYLKQHGPQGLRSLPNDAVEPLGQRMLSRGVAVHLVRCGSRLLLLGVGPDGVRTLSEITDPVEVDLLTGVCRRRDDGGAGAFSQVWQRTAAAQSPPKVSPSLSLSRAEVHGV